MPESKRILITGHDAFGYFARAYGFEVQGLQGVSTGAETGTGRIGELSEYIAKHKVKAIFTETSVPPRGLLQVQNSVKNDHKFTVNLVSEPDSLYSDALGAPGSPGATYAGMVRHNVDVIVRNLK